MKIELNSAQLELIAYGLSLLPKHASDVMSHYLRYEANQAYSAVRKAMGEQDSVPLFPLVP